MPGWNFLGATYGASVVQAFYNFETCGLPNGGCGGGSPIIGGGFVFTNTFINPITLSWNLGGGWFVSASFNFTPPDGTKANGPAAFSFTPNPDYWTFEPALAISYLGPGWVLSGNFFYDINTQSQGTCCAATKITSGNALYGDLMALWKIGKWEIGPVGYFEVQTTADSGGCTPAPGVSLCGNYQPQRPARSLATTSARSTCRYGSPTALSGKTRRKALAASTCGPVSASSSGDQPRRQRRWLPRTEPA